MSDRGELLRGLAPLALVVLLAGAVLVPQTALVSLAHASQPDEGVPAALDELGRDGIVIVGFDPDTGTYPEIRPTVRALLADILARGGRMAFVSVTPEGRALALLELARLGRAEANAARMLDLGFVPGAEAALVELTRSLNVPAADGALARRLADGGLAAVDVALVVGGIDMGPRSWVEQVLPRTPGLSIVAVAPTVLLPELVPYRESGQLAGLIATVAAGAAYRSSLELGNLARLAVDAPPHPAAVVIGLLLAMAALGQGLGTRLLGALRRARTHGVT